LDAAKLEVGGPCEAWHGAAWNGRLVSGGAARPVLVLLGPEGASGDTLHRARSAGAAALQLGSPGILPLLAIQAHGDRVAWVHAHVEGIGLGHVSGSDPHRLLPTRGAAEAVAFIAETLLPLSPEARRNRGPEPTDVIVDPRGGLHVAGFAGPYAMSPSMRAPRGDEGEPAVVYRLGVLLAHLLSGMPPQPASEEAAHAALVRRALIRAMARPGPVLTERYGDWLRGMLAWDPAARPPLSAVPDGLRKVAESMGGDGLASWAAASVERIRQELAGAKEPAPREDEPTDFAEVAATEEMSRALGVGVIDGPPPQRRRGSANSGPDQPTLREIPRERPRQEFVDDDPTQEAASLPPQALRMLAAAPRQPVPQQPQIPVRVGPPPEAIRPPPRLPSGFLDKPPDADDEPDTDKWRAPRTVLVVLVYVGFVGVLAAAAAIFLVYLFWVPGPAQAPPEDEPSLSEALPSAPPATPAGD
jgi:hypothetical protein